MSFGGLEETQHLQNTSETRGRVLGPLPPFRLDDAEGYGESDTVIIWVS